MAAAAHFTANVYGKVNAAPPYQGTNSQNAFGGAFVAFDSPSTFSFPTTGTVFYPVSPGQQVGNTSNYIYSVIELQATGLNVHGDCYASNQSVATLATAAG